MRLAFILVVLLVSGCVPKPVPVPWVGQVHVRGPAPTGRDPLGDPDLPPLKPAKADTVSRARQTAFVARQVITHRQSHWWQFVPLLSFIEKRPYLDAARLDEDADRLRTWLADQGWGEAQVSWAPVQANASWLMNRQHTRFVDITFTVVPGPREVLDHADLFGAKGLPSAVRTALAKVMPDPRSATSPTRRQAVLDALRQVLEDARWPLARTWVEVAGPVEARVERFHVEPGDTPPLGPATVTGTRVLRAAPLERAVAKLSDPGEPWSGAHLHWIARQLEAHPEITSATVEPGTTPDATGALPWTLRIVEAPRDTRDFTTSLSTSGALLGLGAGVDWAHRGIGGGFATVSGVSRVGYRFFDGPGGQFFAAAQHGPATDHRVVLEGAPFPVYRVSLFGSAFGALDTYRGYFQVRALGEAGLRWRPNPRLAFGLFYRGGKVWHFAWPWQTGEFAEGFAPKSEGGLGLRRENDLHAVVLRVDYDSTNHGRLSTRGVKLGLEGVPYGLASGNPWHRLSGDLAWFASAVPERVVLVTRLAFGLNETNDDGDQDGILANRFFLGGAGSMRGWGFQRLGPPGAPGLKGAVMPGGDAMLYASLEARFRAHPDLYFGTFFDVGRTWESVTDRRVDGRVVQRGIHLGDLQPVAGLGVISRSPIGGLELWVGFHLRKESQLDGDPPPVGLQLMLNTGW